MVATFLLILMLLRQVTTVNLRNVLEKKISLRFVNAVDSSRVEGVSVNLQVDMARP